MKRAPCDPQSLIGKMSWEMYIAWLLRPTKVCWQIVMTTLFCISSNLLVCNKFFNPLLNLSESPFPFVCLTACSFWHTRTQTMCIGPPTQVNLHSCLQGILRELQRIRGGGRFKRSWTDPQDIGVPGHLKGNERYSTDAAFQLRSFICGGGWIRVNTHREQFLPLFRRAGPMCS